MTAGLYGDTDLFKAVVFTQTTFLFAFVCFLTRGDSLHKCDISTGGALKIDTNIESYLDFNSLQRLAPQIDGHVNLLCHKGRCHTISAFLVPGKKLKLVLKSQLHT